MSTLARALKSAVLPLLALAALALAGPLKAADFDRVDLPLSSELPPEPYTPLPSTDAQGKRCQSIDWRGLWKDPARRHQGNSAFCTVFAGVALAEAEGTIITRWMTGNPKAFGPQFSEIDLAGQNILWPSAWNDRHTHLRTDIGQASDAVVNSCLATPQLEKKNKNFQNGYVGETLGRILAKGACYRSTAIKNPQIERNVLDALNQFESGRQSLKNTLVTADVGQLSQGSLDAIFRLGRDTLRIPLTEQEKFCTKDRAQVVQLFKATKWYEDPLYKIPEPAGRSQMILHRLASRPVAAGFTHQPKNLDDPWSHAVVVAGYDCRTNEVLLRDHYGGYSSKPGDGGYVRMPLKELGEECETIDFLMP